MASNFGDLHRGLIGGSLSIKGTEIIDDNRNLKAIHSATVGSLSVRNDITVGGNIAVGGLLLAGLQQAKLITQASNNISFIPTAPYLYYMDQTSWTGTVNLQLVDSDIDAYYNSPPIGTCINFNITSVQISSPSYGCSFTGNVAQAASLDVPITYGAVNCLVKVSNTSPKWVIGTTAYD